MVYLEGDIEVKQVWFGCRHQTEWRNPFAGSSATVNQIPSPGFSPLWDNKFAPRGLVAARSRSVWWRGSTAPDRGG